MGAASGLAHQALGVCRVQGVDAADSLELTNLRIDGGEAYSNANTPNAGAEAQNAEIGCASWGATCLLEIERKSIRPWNVSSLRASTVRSLAPIPILLIGVST